VSGVQSLLAALLTEGVARRGMPLPLLVRLVSGAPARLAGIHPRKGAIAPGSDADLALVDLRREWTLEASALQTRSGISPYLGMRFTGAIARTIVRGTTVYREGEFLAAPGYGRFVRREA
jgi:allantoinase